MKIKLKVKGTSGWLDVDPARLNAQQEAHYNAGRQELLAQELTHSSGYFDGITFYPRHSIVQVRYE